MMGGVKLAMVTTLREERTNGRKGGPGKQTDCCVKAEAFDLMSSRFAGAVNDELSVELMINGRIGRI